MATFDEIKQIRQKRGLSQQKMSEMFNIPLRTWENWERGLRTPPQYVIDLILFKLKAER